MKNSIVAYVGWLLLLAALGFYGYGIVEAIRLSWPFEPAEKPIVYFEVLSTTIGSLQALLLANLGIVLGISIADPNSNIARAMMISKSTHGPAMARRPPMDVKDQIQLWAVVVYILSLIACLVTWIVNGFSMDSKQVVSLIPESGKMFLGVVLAYIAALLR